MKFKIITDDGKETEYDSFSQCGKEMNLDSKTLFRFLRNNIHGGKFTRRSDGKIFWIEQLDVNIGPQIIIDGETFYSIPKVLRKFGLNSTKFLNQLKKNHYGFLDANKIPHKIDWMSDCLSYLIQYRKTKNTDEAAKFQLKCFQELGGKSAKGGNVRSK